MTTSPPAPPRYVHSFRRNLLCSERTYWLGSDGLQWRDEQAAGYVAYRDISEVREYKSKVYGTMSARTPRRFDYVLRSRDGKKIALYSMHHARFRLLEDRSPSCTALAGEQKKRVASASPDAKFLHELRW
ncbi:MAG: hypothetical protein ACREH9_01920, partial [Pseudomonadota bacterium]